VHTEVPVRILSVYGRIRYSRPFWLGVSWSFMLASLRCNALILDETPPPGFFFLMIGWMVPIPWSANLLLVVAWSLFVFDRPRAASVLALVATFAGLTVWFLVPHLTPLVGYFLWEGRFVALALGSRLIWKHNEEQSVPEVWKAVP
jgi:hypothetical protein